MGKRGFGSMSPEEVKRIASLGGKAAHAQGSAHEWTSEEASKWGRVGGTARSAKRHEPPDPKPAA